MDKILYRFETLLRKQISRGAFLKILLGWLLFFVADMKLVKFAFAKKGDSTGRPNKGIEGVYDLVEAKGSDPYQNTVKVIQEMGGMRRFVKPGEVVVVKPNMAWDRSPEQAANTNPSVVAALVDMAYQAGARKVKVFDVPCNDEKRVHENSGIAKIAKEHGADVFYVNHWDIVKAKYAGPSAMENWPILRDAVACDVFINVPVLKHHRLAGLTLSMKNLMGVCSGTRGLMHVDIGNKLVDLNRFINPDLIVVDATRVLTKHGPSGGNLADVEMMNKVFAATDATLADSYAAHLFGVDPMSIPNIEVAINQGYGNADIRKANIKKVIVG